MRLCAIFSETPIRGSRAVGREGNGGIADPRRRAMHSCGRFLGLEMQKTAPSARGKGLRYFTIVPLRHHIALKSHHTTVGKINSKNTRFRARPEGHPFQARTPLRS